MAFETYPTVDDVTKAFPPAVRAAIAQATEVTGMVDSKVNSQFNNGVKPRLENLEGSTLAINAPLDFDANSVTEQAVHNVSSSDNPLNMPGPGSWNLFTWPLAGVLQQMAILYESTAPEIHIRVKTSNGWQSWHRTDAREILDMLEVVNLPDTPELAFVIADEDRRATDIEIGADGHFSERVIESITPRVGGTLPMNDKVTGLAFAVVDEDGRETELQVGQDGRLTQRVINSIAGRLPDAQMPEITPPVPIAVSEAARMVGQTYKLYHEDYIDALSKDHTAIVRYGRGDNLGSHWEFTPTVAETVNATLEVLDRTGDVVTSKFVPFQTYSVPSGTGKRHLAIGDSITRAGEYAKYAIEAIPGATTVGTREYSGATHRTEGRGGWALSGYFTNIGHEQFGDSPFLFPVGVAGAKFLGATEFWRKVCYDDPNGYDFSGFQKIARGWKSSPEPFLFGPTGYPTAPTEGDVVVDATLPEADEFRIYSGGAWTRMNPQPAVEFSFSKYMERYAAAFPDGGPTSVSIMLETNDFFNSLDDNNFGVWKGRMDTLIASLRAWSATVPLVILLAPTGGPWEKWTNQSVIKFEFDRRMRSAASRIITAYDTPASKANHVHVASFLGAVSPENMGDWVHPLPAGHAEMAPHLAGILAKLITEGA